MLLQERNLSILLLNNTRIRPNEKTKEVGLIPTPEFKKIQDATERIKPIHVINNGHDKLYFLSDN